MYKQYLNFETQNQKIYKGELSTNLHLNDSDLFSKKATIFENNDFRNENFNRILFENFTEYLSTNTETIIKDKINNFNPYYNIIQSIFFYSFFYFCISMIFLSKKLVNRDINTLKIFLLVLSIFLYYLLIPKIMLNNFQYIFQFISLIIFVLTFFKIKHYE